MRKSLYLSLIASGAAALLWTGAASAEPSAKANADACAGCHGADGSSHGPAVPTIAGMGAGYFTDVMMEFKDGKRSGTIMGRIAKGYSEAEIKAMAKFYEGQKFVRFEQKVDAAAVKRGDELQKKYCERCHEQGGKKSDDAVGPVAGQPLTYLMYAVEDFLSGKRAISDRKKKQAMDDMQKDHGQKGFDAVNVFYAGQK